MQELDLSGLKCPLPVLRTQKALKSLNEGDSLAILTTDPMAAIDLPHFCNEQGHTIVETQELEASAIRFVIKI